MLLLCMHLLPIALRKHRRNPKGSLDSEAKGGRG